MNKYHIDVNEVHTASVPVEANSIYKFFLKVKKTNEKKVDN